MSTKIGKPISEQNIALRLNTNYYKIMSIEMDNWTGSLKGLINDHYFDLFIYKVLPAYQIPISYNKHLFIGLSFLF